MIATVFWRVEVGMEVDMGADFSRSVSRPSSDSDIRCGGRNSDCTESAAERVRKRRVEQEFAVSFAAENGRVDRLGVTAAKMQERRLDFGHGCLLGCVVANDSAFAHQFPARFKLRFYEDDNVAVNRLSRVTSRPGGRRRRANHGWQDQRRGDKRNVHGNEIDGLAEVGWLEIAGISFFEEAQSEIIAQLEIYLTIARVDCDHPGCTVLEHAIAEAAGGSADVETDSVAKIDLPVFESLL